MQYRLLVPKVGRRIIVGKVQALELDERGFKL